MPLLVPSPKNGSTPRVGEVTSLDIYNRYNKTGGELRGLKELNVKQLQNPEVTSYNMSYCNTLSPNKFSMTNKVKKEVFLNTLFKESIKS